MADPKREVPKTKNEPVSPCREALGEGDHGLARRLAQAVLADPAASVQAKADAQAVFEATRVDGQAIVAGALAAAVLLLLFGLTLTGHF